MELQPILIQTPRLILKGLTPEDITYIFENYTKEDIKKLLGHQSDEEYQKEAYRQMKGYTSFNNRFMQFIIADKFSGANIGRCLYHSWSPEHKRAEIAYYITVESFKGQGLMSEAVSAVLDYGFHQMQLHRIEALVAPDNTASLRIIKKFGFTQEGVLREHYYTNNQYEDSFVFSLLRREYMSR